MNANSARIELLNKKNYDTWKMQMQAVLVKNDLWEFVSAAKVKPEPGVENANAAAVREWEKNDQKARSDLILSISPSELKQVKNCETSRAMWLKLQEIYQSQGPARKATLLKRLTLHKMVEGGDVHDHLNEFFDTVDKLGEMNIEIHPDQLAIMLLYSLPSSFENFRCAIESRDELPAPEALRAKILDESAARQTNACGETTNAMFANKKGKQFNSKKKPVTIKNDKSDNEKSKSSKKSKCYICKRLGHLSTECWFKDRNKKQSESTETGNVCFHSAAVSTQNTSTTWCLDSGASTHLCHNLNHFQEISYEKCGTLNLANNSSTDITGKGTAQFVTNCSGNKKIVTLTDTSHVPDLRTNLLSVGKITEKGFEVIFKEKGAEILNADGNIELYADRIGDLYYIRQFEEDARAVSSQKPIKIPFELLHRRLGHANARDISDAVNKNLVTGVQIASSTTKLECQTCHQGKMPRLPFP